MFDIVKEKTMVTKNTHPTNEMLYDNNAQESKDDTDQALEQHWCYDLESSFNEYVSDYSDPKKIKPEPIRSRLLVRATLICAFSDDTSTAWGHIIRSPEYDRMILHMTQYAGVSVRICMAEAVMRDILGPEAAKLKTEAIAQAFTYIVKCDTGSWYMDLRSLLMKTVGYVLLDDILKGNVDMLRSCVFYTARSIARHQLKDKHLVKHNPETFWVMCELVRRIWGPISLRDPVSVRAPIVDAMIRSIDDDDTFDEKIISISTTIADNIVDWIMSPEE
jgi:hypothetical protein